MDVGFDAAEPRRRERPRDARRRDIDVLTPAGEFVDVVSSYCFFHRGSPPRRLYSKPLFGAPLQAESAPNKVTTDDFLNPSCGDEASPFKESHETEHCELG
jgi:hypothetical protein